ncbi:MAG TPA: dephospho-CoA kinase [Candidatus Glassbacteria bacterium]|nr:dephospho-CoA kinase [Candidatus Glassbacteria bacterium]
MIVIGLTGNTGSGKSTVAHIWKDKRGALLIDADEIGRQVVNPGSETLELLVKRFGSEILLPDGSLDRRRTAELAFTGEESLQALNSIVHPAIIRSINSLLRTALAEGVSAVVIDAALLYEFGFDRSVDVMVAVDAPREVKIARMLSKGKLERRTIERMLDLQMDPAEMKKMAGWVIENDGGLEELESKALELFDRLVK